MDDDDDDDDDEEYEEARDSLYDQQDNDNASTTTHTGTGSHSSRPKHNRHSSGVSIGDSSSNPRDPAFPKNSPWRRRVEQALTKMTAEIAAVREQMEARTLAHRRRSGVWAWLKWILWTVVRQIIWDLALLGGLLIYMRVRGDRRVEDRLRTGWSEVKAKLGRFKLLRRVRDMPLLP